MLAGNACVRQNPWSTLSDKIAWRQAGAKQFCQTTLIYYRVQHIKQLSIKLLMKLKVFNEKNVFQKVLLLLAFKSRRSLRVKADEHFEIHFSHWKLSVSLTIWLKVVWYVVVYNISTFLTKLLGAGVAPSNFVRQRWPRILTHTCLSRHLRVKC